MNVFDKMINNLNAFDEGNYFQDFISANDEFITSQNKRRLNEKGTNVDGEELRTFRAEAGEAYNRFTINMKLAKGQTWQHVTLKDTGAFYNTFKVDAKKSSFTVIADDNKPDGSISDNVDVNSALGLYYLQPLIDLLTVDLRKELLSVIRK